VIRCHVIEANLSGWVDGALSEHEAEVVRRHLDECAACRAVERSLRELVGDLGRLPAADPVPARQWEAIRARLESQPAPATAQGSRSWGLAAAAAVVVALIGVWVVQHQRDDRAEEIARIAQELARPVETIPVGSPEAVSAAALEPKLPPELEQVDAALRAARTQLDAVLQSRRATLSAETLAVVDQNLRLMERATREIRLALVRDPGSAPLRQMFVASQRRQLEMLQQVTRLAAYQEKTR
jgi:anti-sigma factor RsiW